MTPSNLSYNGPPSITRRVLLCFTVAVAVTLVLLAINSRLDKDRIFNGPTSQTRCQEDDPCWDCSTMGNHICGPRSVP